MCIYVFYIAEQQQPKHPQSSSEKSIALSSKPVIETKPNDYELEEGEIPPAEEDKFDKTIMNGEARGN